MKFKLFAVLALAGLSTMAYAAPEVIEICAKSRSFFKWNNAFKYENAILLTGNYLNETVFERQAVPSGNYIWFNYGTEEDMDLKLVKLNSVLTSAYQEVEDTNSEQWMVAKKMPNQICR